MASLTITIGPKSGSVTASDVKATNVLTDVAALFNITGTQQQQLDAVALLLKQKLQEWSKQQRLPDALETTEQTIETDPDHLWEI